MRKEIEKKILSLIHKELENIGGENIFHNTTDGFWFPTSPLTERPFVTKRNDDEIESCKHEFIRFTLKFEDGEPDISIYTQANIKEEKREFYRYKWYIYPFGGKRLYTDYTNYEFKTNVRCGNVSFNLTHYEHLELVEKTRIAYDRFLSLKSDAENKRLSDKIDLRLSKHQ